MQIEDEKFIQITRLLWLPSEPAEDAGPAPPLGHQLQVSSGTRRGGTRKSPGRPCQLYIPWSRCPHDPHLSVLPEKLRLATAQVCVCFPGDVGGCLL